jgi:hypothetical protein
VSTAYGAQIVLALVVAVLVALAWRSRARHESKAALALAGTLLMSPFCLSYDFVALVPAGAFLLKAQMARGPRSERLEGVLLAAAMLTLPTAVLWPEHGVLFGLPALGLVFGAALWSVRADGRGVGAGTS